MKKSILLIALIVGLLMSACGANKQSSENAKIPQDGDGVKDTEVVDETDNEMELLACNSINAYGEKERVELPTFNVSRIEAFRWTEDETGMLSSVHYDCVALEGDGFDEVKKAIANRWSVDQEYAESEADRLAEISSNYSSTWLEGGVYCFTFIYG